MLAAGVECRGSAGACDVAEVCDGAHAACPADALAPAGTPCGDAADACEIAPTCSGSSTVCPAALTKGGMEGALCAFDRGIVPAVCAASGVPATVSRPFDRAGSLARQAAGATGVRQKKLYRRASGMLRKVGKAVTKAERRKPHLSAECAAAVRRLLDDLGKQLLSAGA
jgi:hypothetical protein